MKRQSWRLRTQGRRVRGGLDTAEGAGRWGARQGTEEGRTQGEQQPAVRGKLALARFISQELVGDQEF